MEDQERTCVALETGYGNLLFAVLAVAVMKPFRFLRALNLILKIGGRSDRGWNAALP